MGTDRRQILEYKGKRIVFHDYSDLAGDEFVRVIEEISLQATADPAKRRLVLMNATNAIVDRPVMCAFREMTANASELVLKGAFYGLTGIQNMFMAIISDCAKTPLKAFETREAALEWLVLGD